MKRIFQYIAIVIILFGIMSCEQEVLEITETIDNEPETIELIQSSISGQVLDLDGQEIENAIVDVLVQSNIFESVLTDENGYFEFTNTKVNETSTLLRITHPDFATGFKTPILEAGVRNYTKINLGIKQSRQFSEGEQIIYDSELLSFKMQTEQLRTTPAGDLVLDVGLKELDNIKSISLLPIEGENLQDESVFLSHKFVFDIRLNDQDQNPLTLKNDETIDVSINHPFDSSQDQLWYFEEEKARWVEYTGGTIDQENKLPLTNLGLYSIASTTEMVLITGQTKNELNEILSNVQVSFIDSDNLLINETYTNSNGKFTLQVERNIEGTLVISKRDFEDNTIPITTTQSRDEGELTLTQVCNPIVIKLEPFICTEGPTPAELTMVDLSDISQFSLSLENQTGTTTNANSTFTGIQWDQLTKDEIVVYNFSYTNDQGIEFSCSGEILLVDTIPPVAVCLENITISLMGKDEVQLFAIDIDAGSHDSGCGPISEILIIRGEQCENMGCEKEDFSTSISYTAADIGELRFAKILVIDGAGNSTICATMVSITN